MSRKPDDGSAVSLEREWTAIVLPDTQIYSKLFPELLEAQLAWVAHNHQRLGIRVVIHVGDVVNDNVREQWDRASRAFSRIDGRVPYVIALGNHDYGPAGDGSNRETLFLDHFPPERLGGGTVGYFESGRADNAYRVIETPSGRWLVMALEFAPRPRAVAWARDALEQYRAVPALLANHAFLYSDGTRYDAEKQPAQRWSPHFYGVAEAPEGFCDAEALWQRLIVPCRNVVTVFSGHAIDPGTNRRSDARPDGTIVHQLFANYQTEARGGDGFLRIVRFIGNRRIEVQTYSPALDQFRTDEENQFVLELGQPDDRDRSRHVR